MGKEGHEAFVSAFYACDTHDQVYHARTCVSMMYKEFSRV